jgi:hypothetical protein
MRPDRFTILMRRPWLICTTMALIAACSPKTPTSAIPAGGSKVATGSVKCLPDGSDFLRAQLRGAVNADLRWQASELQCDGGARPDGNGLRISLSGPLDSAGHRLRMVFGVAARPGENGQAERPTNITLLMEDGNKLYATLGDGKCTMDTLTQSPLPGTDQPGTNYRIAARGFCVDPAATLDGRERVYIDRFDFATRIQFEPGDLHHADQPT